MTCVVCGRDLKSDTERMSVDIGDEVIHTCSGECDNAPPAAVHPDLAAHARNLAASDASALNDRLLDAVRDGKVLSSAALPVALKASDRVAAMLGLDESPV